MSSADVPPVSHQERPIDVTGVLSTQDADWPDALVDTAAALLRMSRKRIGSASLLLMNRRTVSASIRGVMSPALYLGGILVLHITIPALFSMESFTSSRSVPVRTRGLPSFNLSGLDFSNETYRDSYWLTILESGTGSLYFLPSILGSTTTVGVRDGTLYDVPEPNAGQGNVTVNAIGFNLTCGYLKNVETTKWTLDKGRWTIVVDGMDAGSVSPTERIEIGSLLLCSGVRVAGNHECEFGLMRCRPKTNIPVPSISAGHPLAIALGNRLCSLTTLFTFPTHCMSPGRYASPTRPLRVFVPSRRVPVRSTPSIPVMEINPTRFQARKFLPPVTTQPGIISTVMRNETFYPWNYTLWYSTIPIVDSKENIGPRVSLKPPMNTSVSEIQLLSCSQSLVSQTAVLDAQSLRLMAVNSSIEKSVSSWTPATLTREDLLKNPVDMLGEPDPLLLLHSWQALYGSGSMPVSPIPLMFDLTVDIEPLFLSVADLYLNQKLGLLAPTPKSEIFLHDVENTLSTIVAAMFWTVGNIAPPPGYEGFVFHKSDNPSHRFQIHEPSNSPIMLEGNATVNTLLTQITAGLAISIALILLSLPFSIPCKHAKPEIDIPIDGVGILHAIWLYRNHPQLETLLKQVDHPTDNNLRAAGMIRTTLIGGGLRRRRSSESIQL
ncbi:hypothetical protein B0H14DRAFT_2596512 [Mycena olivaceomarginata]|nr:hypothetical protein B0H14DRAFT_2596512 [Mycena olivaceomarginata]